MHDRHTFQQRLEEAGFKYTNQREVLEFLAGNSNLQLVGDFLRNDVDLLVSYLYPERIRPTLLKLPRLAAVNFHPAPLPDYGGFAAYSGAILDERTEYGVTVHHMDTTLDTGDIIFRKSFEIDPESITALDLEMVTAKHLFKAFKEFIAMVASNSSLAGTPQDATNYVSLADLEASKKIYPLTDSADIVERKARAFWYPPYDGAYVEICGKRFTIVPDHILRKPACFYATESRR